MNWERLARSPYRVRSCLAASRGFKWDSMNRGIELSDIPSHIFIYDVMAKFAPYSLVPSHFAVRCVPSHQSFATLGGRASEDRFRKNLLEISI